MDGQPERRTGVHNDVRQEFRDHEHGILDDVLAQPPPPQQLLTLTTDTHDGLDRRFTDPLRLSWPVPARQTTPRARALSLGPSSFPHTARRDIVGSFVAGWPTPRVARWG